MKTARMRVLFALCVGVACSTGCGKKEKPGWQQALEKKEVVPLREPAPVETGIPAMPLEKGTTGKSKSGEANSDFIIPPPPKLDSVHKGSKQAPAQSNEGTPKLGKPN